MRYITRITWNNILTVERGTVVHDTQEYYLVRFPGYDSRFGDVKVYKPKKKSGPTPDPTIGRIYVAYCTYENVLYISEKHYHANPFFVQKLAVSWRKNNDTRKWLRKTI